MEKDGKSDDESMTMSDVSSNGPEKSSVTNGTMKMPEDEGGRDIDYLLDNVIGGGGWGQWIVLLCQLPIGIASGLPTLIHMFAAFEPRHRCYVPICEDISNPIVLNKRIFF